MTVAPGVTDARNERLFANELARAIEWANQGALLAAERGTFCVGGVLLGPGGRLLARSSNRVLSQGRLTDPTAHGERQLVDWYHHHASELPPPQDCLIVSSLDPCCMCAGAILHSGLRVLTLAHDPQAGVNFRGDARFLCLAQELREQARHSFSYVGIENVRDFQGTPPWGERFSVSQEVEDLSRSRFEAGLETVKALIHTSMPCRDPHQLEHLRGEFPRRSGPQALQDWEAALIDPYGNLVAAANSQGGIRTAVLELTRSWSARRAAAHEDELPFLAHFKECTLWTRLGPARDARSLMELGAYGSSVEGPLPPSPRGRWLYLEETQSETNLGQMLRQLPPFYSEVVGLRVEAAKGS